MVWPLEQTLPQIAWRSTVCAWALLNFVFITTKNDSRGSSRVWTWLISVANAAGLAYLVLGRPSLNLLPAHWQWVAPWDQPGNPLYDAVDDQAKVWMWWASLSLASVMNLFFLAYVMLTRSSADSDTAATRVYEWRMKWLAVPFVLQCGYRSVFPEVYAGDCAVDGPGCQATRLVFFDDPLNGVLVGRGLAAVGEIAFVVQLALAVQHLNNNLAVWSRRSSVVNVVSVLVVLLITVAEGFSYACTATTWNVYCACENSLWTTCVVLLALSAAYLYYNAEAVLGMEADADKAARQRKTNSNSIFFCVMLFLALFTYVPFMVLVDVPMYIVRWKHDTAIGKHYFSLADGMVDAWDRRDATQSYAVWKDEMVWRGVYFTVVVWGSILLIHAPRFTFAAPKKQKGQ